MGSVFTRVLGYVRSNHLALVAIVLAGTGTAYAAATIGSRDVINNSLRPKDVKNASSGSDAINADKLDGKHASAFEPATPDPTTAIQTARERPLSQSGDVPILTVPGFGEVIVNCAAEGVLAGQFRFKNTSGGPLGVTSQVNEAAAAHTFLADDEQTGLTAAADPVTVTYYVGRNTGDARRVATIEATSHFEIVPLNNGCGSLATAVTEVLGS